jgi:hypothetical protein
MVLYFEAAIFDSDANSFQRFHMLNYSFDRHFQAKHHCLYGLQLHIDDRWTGSSTHL